MIRKIIKYIHNNKKAALERELELKELQQDVKIMKCKFKAADQELRLREAHIKRANSEANIMRFHDFENRRKAVNEIRKIMIG